jgi:hypothetical protein
MPDVPKQEYTVDELIAKLKEFRDARDGNGRKMVVLKTPGSGMYPNATYNMVVDPSYRSEDDARLQIWPGGRRV